MREGIIRLTEEQINSNYYKIEEVFHSQYDFMELNALRDEICRVHCLWLFSGSSHSY